MKIDFGKFIIKFLLLNKRIKKSEFVNSDEFENVCFFSNSAIGDTLFNTPVFRAFKQNFPNKKAVAVLDPRNYVLFKNDPNLDEIILYRNKWRNFFQIAKILKNKKIDTIFILHSNEPQATPLAVFSGAKYIFKLPNLHNEFNKFHSNSPSDENLNEYVVQRRLNQLKFIGIDSSDTKMQIFFDDDDFTSVNEIFENSKKFKFIGFQMGASVISRQWIFEYWGELAKMLLKHENIKIILTGSPGERKITDRLEQILGSDRVLNLAGNFNLRKSAALISKLDLFITPDTGPLHIAIATKTPTISLYGSSNHKEVYPNYDQEIHKFIQKPIICKLCEDRKCICQKGMRQIKPSEVYEKIKEFGLFND